MCHQKAERAHCLAGTADFVTDEPGDSGMQHPAIAPARVIRQRPQLLLPAHANHTDLCRHACETRTFTHWRTTIFHTHAHKSSHARRNSL